MQTAGRDYSICAYLYPASATGPGVLSRLLESRDSSRPLFFLAVMLMINILGYVLGHYPQHFALTDDQRTLILQTTSFMIRLAIGAAIFQQLVAISFSDALYFSDVTVLTLGYGDITAGYDVARSLIFPYAVVGIIRLALIVASVS